jgi:hypothetical protein
MGMSKLTDSGQHCLKYTAMSINFAWNLSLPVTYTITSSYNISYFWRFYLPDEELFCLSFLEGWLFFEDQLTSTHLGTYQRILLHCCLQEDERVCTNKIELIKNR